MITQFTFFIRPEKPVEAAERIKKWLAGQSDYEATIAPSLTAIEIKVTQAPFGMTTEKIKQLFEEVAG